MMRNTNSHASFISRAENPAGGGKTPATRHRLLSGGRVVRGNEIPSLERGLASPCVA